MCLARWERGRSGGRASVSSSACFAPSGRGAQQRWRCGRARQQGSAAAYAQQQQGSAVGCGGTSGSSIMRRPPCDGTKHHSSSKACGCAAAGHSGGDRGMALHACHPAAARPRQWRRGGSGVGSEGHRVHRTWMRSRVGVPMVANYSLTFQSYFSAFAKFRVAGGADHGRRAAHLRPDD